MLSNETPCLIMLSKEQWQDLLDIVSKPSMLSGSELEARYHLLSALRETVTADLYNSCIINSYESAKLLKAKIEEVPAESTEPKPVAANRASNFVPPSRDPKYTW